VKPFHRIALVSAVIGLGASVAATSSVSHASETSDTSSTGTCALSAILEPCDNFVLFGARVMGYGDGTWQNQTLDADSRYGRQVDVVHNYHAPDSVPVPLVHNANKPKSIGMQEEYFATHGRILFLNFRAGNDWNEVANTANKDDIIDAAAENVARIKGSAKYKVMLTLFHEPEDDATSGGDDPDGDGNPGGSGCAEYKGDSKYPGNTPENYRKMWHKVQDRFKEKGADNVVWVMTYQALEKWDCLTKAMWPGDDRVDWVGYDPYTRRPSGGLGDVTRFAQHLINSSDATHHFTDKPWILTEYGSVCEGNSQPAADFYDQVRGLIDAGTYPKLKGLLMFDVLNARSDYRTYYACPPSIDEPAPVDEDEQKAFNRLAQDELMFTLPKE